MTRYEVFKFLHVVGAIAWVGGGLGLLLLSRRLVAVGDHAGVLSIGRQSKALGNALFMPASLTTLVFGVLLVATEPALRFTDLWILLGFGGIAASAVIGMGFLEKAGGQIGTLVAEHGPDSPEVLAAIRRVNNASALDVAVLVLVVWAMIAKPTL